MIQQIALTLPDGKIVHVPAGVTVRDAASVIGPKLAAAALGGIFNGDIVDLRSPLTHSGAFTVVTATSPQATEIFRHSMAHIMAEAVLALFPEAQFGIGPTIEQGFYYDFLLARPLTPEDLTCIEARMRESIAAKAEFTCEELSRAQAIELFTKLNQPFKLELINDLGNEQHLSVYRHGAFIDLCRGPHVPHSGVVKHFKLLSIAGAYWRGDEKRPMLQRIYGTAFADKKALDQHLHMIEEAKKRDHRRLGKDLDLFSTHEEVGPGLVFWHPKGARIRNTLETFWREQHYRHGYELLYTPHIGRSWLWETSGHLDFYKDSMYSPMQIDEGEYFIKPMNCPFHIMIYKSQTRSYRDLPLRWAELGTVYRYEKSGVLHGLLRVRGFTQDDAHIICTPEQIDAEIVEVLRFSLALWRALGFDKIKAYLATRPEKAVGEPARWEKAIAALTHAAKQENLECEVDEGGGAFYGPKIDLKIQDALGREWQMTTIQFDFNLSERFDMTYVGSDGSHHRPYMVHRALLGAIERFFAILIEHYGGALPLWLAPVQVAILPISDKHLEYSRNVEATCRKAGVRVWLDMGNEKIGYKIRQAQLQKIPFMLILGEEESTARKVTVRSRTGENRPGLDLAAFLQEQEWAKDRV